MNARTEYELAQFGSLAVLGVTIYGTMVSPPSWAGWAVPAIFALLWVAMVWCSPRLLKLSLRICYLGLIASAVTFSAGVAGVFLYSVELAIFLPISLIFAFMLLINLAGIRRAIQLSPPKNQSDAEGGDA
jgi:hypothetical protein